MDTSDLRFFEAVARAGSMSRASEVLHTVQSNVTSRIQVLENELGIRLFERTSRGVHLTSAGERLMPYATQIANLLEDARRAATDDGVPRGKVMLGTLETTAAMRLSPMLARFCAQFPDVDLTLRTGTTGELITQVLERAIDGALVCGPVEHPQLHEQTLFDEELVVLTAPSINSLEAVLKSTDLKVIVLRAGCSYRLILEAALARRGVVGFRLLEFGTLESIIGCVSAGLGITLLPRRLIGTVWSTDRVTAHSLEPDLAKVKTVFISRKDGYPSAALNAFIETALREWRLPQSSAT